MLLKESNGLTIKLYAKFAIHAWSTTARQHHFESQLLLWELSGRAGMFNKQ